ncbi:hypothetical protein NIES2100_79790 (plasmid) [Calothrix sp. NIES-2100]|uniref:hypothetical protein n=1 Tax=Calothrix sp. NIES-2100 TaxID=1954172 RepID=UPI000B5E3813|nr:hypothetical protein NIES2100_79790 [Calothrix sp. NIES-2100]
MSLSKFLEISDVKAKFNSEFPKPQFQIKQQILAPPIFNGNPQLVGAAFDYLLRFYLKYLNPQAEERMWVAEEVVQKLKIENKNYEPGHLVVEQAKKLYRIFLKTGEFTDELFQVVLSLASLDEIQRCGYTNRDLQFANQQDVEDLKNLIGIVNSEIFKSRGKVILNPTWLSAKLVGKADGDLIFDNDLLVDFKTIKNLSLERRDFNQLMGYYVLSHIDRLSSSNTVELKRLGIYFSRYGILYQFNVAEVVKRETFPEFLKWFIARAQEYVSQKA